MNLLRLCLLHTTIFALVCATAVHSAIAQVPPDNTVVYCRHNPTNDLSTVWFASLAGGSDTLVTTGWMARVSLDRRYLVFLRNGPNGSAYGSRGDLWVRDLVTGAETNLYHNSDYIVGADFTRDASLVMLDYLCADYSIARDGSANGNLTLLSGGNCYDDGPAVNPVDGRVACHNNSSGGGIEVADINFQNKTLVPNTAQGTYALWSHDGQWLSYTMTSDYYTYLGYNLHKIRPDGSAHVQLTFLSGSTNFFAFGAAWTPDDRALIGAATLSGTNGLYEVAADGSGAIIRLDILTPGDPVAYVGAVVGPGLPRLTASRTGTNTVTVSWPSPSTGYSLQVSTNLGATNWTSVSEIILDDGTNKSIVVNPPVGGRFYRLNKP